MKIKKIFGIEESPCNCGNSGCSNCPTVYELENGDYVVQGYVDEAASSDVKPPQGESVVRLPKAFLDAFIAKATAKK